MSQEMKEKGGTSHSVLSDVCVCAYVLSVWIYCRFLLITVSVSKMMVEEADQNLLTAHISATHISEHDGDVPWKLFS